MQSELELLSRYLPDGTASYVLEKLKRYPVTFKIVNPRRTKLGDFKVRNRGLSFQITVNNDLDPINFLMTTLHEIAHLYNWKEYKGKIAPHGKEWKQEYKNLFAPILNKNYFNEKDLNMLKQHLVNPKASSAGDETVQKFLKKEGVTYLEDLEINAVFILGKKMFRIEKKLRKRYLCLDVISKKKYYVQGMAEVRPFPYPIDDF